MNKSKFFLLLLLAGCSLQEGQEDRTKRQNASREEIMRKEGEQLYPLPALQPGSPPTYFWEEKPSKP